MDLKVTALFHLPLFDLVSDPKSLSEVANSLQIIKVPKGGIVYKSGFRFDSLVFVNSGLMRSSELGRDGRVTAAVNIPAGQWIGLMYLFVKKARMDSLQALQDSEIWVLESRAVEKTLLNSPMAMARYCQLLIAAMHNIHKDRMALLQDRAESRILAVLAKYAQKRDKNTILEDLPSQQALADLANTSRETVSRAINKWFDQGILAKEGGKITIKKIENFKYFM